MLSATDERDFFLARWEPEFETMLRVLRAYPTGKDVGAKVPSIYGPTADEPWM